MGVLSEKRNCFSFTCTEAQSVMGSMPVSPKIWKSRTKEVELRNIMAPILQMENESTDNAQRKSVKEPLTVFTLPES